MWGDKFKDNTWLDKKEIAPYLLVALQRVDGAPHLKDAIKKTRSLLDINEDLKNKRYNEGTGDLSIDSQTGRAMSLLKRVNCTKIPKVGYWELTSKGIDLAKQLSENFEDSKIVEELRNELKEEEKKYESNKQKR